MNALADEKPPEYFASFNPAKGFKPAQADLTEIFLQIAGSLEYYGSPVPYLCHMKAEHTRIEAKYRQQSGTEPKSYLPAYTLHDDTTGQPALLGTRKLRTLLLLCMRNASTGSAWPISNNPKALYNLEGEHGSNLILPLWQLVRASAAAPVFFLPENIKVGKSAFEFADGGLTPYCNPALIAVLTATLLVTVSNGPSARTASTSCRSAPAASRTV